jgi:hypothetical protein
MLYTGDMPAKKHVATRSTHPASGGDDLELRMEPVGYTCPKCQEPIMVVHGHTPLLLLSCDCRQKFIKRWNANIIASWPKQPKRSVGGSKRSDDDDEDDDD